MPRRRRRAPRAYSSAYSWYPPPASRPKPADGIKARSKRGDIGESWWSRRFIDILESLGMGPRLARGRNYARRGQVLSVDVAPGEVIGVVQGSRPRPYHVTIGVLRLSGKDWTRAQQAMASRAAFAAMLLAGEMPKDIEEAFAECRISLFPTSSRELTSDCSCPDWANPCKHVAAVYYLLAEAFDDDPFLIFRWRGRDREELLGSLRTLRSGRDSAPSRATALEIPAPAHPLASALRSFWVAGDELDSVRALPRRAEPADVLLRRLQAPGVDVAGEDLTALVAAAYPAITEHAYRQALRPVLE